MSEPDVDPLVATLPIHVSHALTPNLHIHQFPLLNRPLQVPPSAEKSGKKIKARLKPNVRRMEVHVPVDVRPEVWNKEKGEMMGQARAEEDQAAGGKGKENADIRLTEVRMSSEQIPHRGAYMLGIVRDGHLYLHPISQTHQFRPSLTYMDVLHRRTQRRKKTGAESDSDSDEGPPPDPDEPAPINPPPKASSKASSSQAKEVQVSVKKVEEKGGQLLTGGLSNARREMLTLLRNEEEEDWQDLGYFGGETEEANRSFDAVFTAADTKLTCSTNLTAFVKSIDGL